MNLPVFLPEHREIDARPLDLASEQRPVRLGTPAKASLGAGAGKQRLL
jgi:hypothetical protein